MRPDVASWVDLDLPERRTLRRRDRQRGAASIEFVLLTVVLLVPFVYAVLTVAEVQRAAFAVSGASREAARAYVTAPDGRTAESRAHLAAGLALDSQGVHGAEVEVRCPTDPCLRPGRRVTTVVTVRVALPLVPAFGDFDPTVRVRARHVAIVDEFRAARS